MFKRKTSSLESLGVRKRKNENDERYYFLNVNVENPNLWINLKNAFNESPDKSKLNQWIVEVISRLELFQVNNDRKYYKNVLDNFPNPLFLNQRPICFDIFLDILIIIFSNFTLLEIINLHKTCKTWWWLTLPIISFGRNFNGTNLRYSQMPMVAYINYPTFMKKSNILIDKYSYKSNKIQCEHINITSSCFNLPLESGQEEYSFSNIYCNSATIQFDKIKKIDTIFNLILPNCNELYFTEPPSFVQKENFYINNDENIRKLGLDNTKSSFSSPYSSVLEFLYNTRNFNGLTSLYLKLMGNELKQFVSSSLKNLNNITKFSCEIVLDYEKELVQTLMNGINDAIIFPRLEYLDFQCKKFSKNDIYLKTHDDKNIMLKDFFKFFIGLNHETLHLKEYSRYIKDKRISIRFDNIMIPKTKYLKKIILNFIPGNFLIHNQQSYDENYHLFDIGHKLEISASCFSNVLLVDYYFRLLDPFVRDTIQLITHHKSIDNIFVNFKEIISNYYRKHFPKEKCQTNFLNFIETFDDQLDYYLYKENILPFQVFSSIYMENPKLGNQVWNIDKYFDRRSICENFRRIGETILIQNLTKYSENYNFMFSYLIGKGKDIFDNFILWFGILKKFLESDYEKSFFENEITMNLFLPIMKNKKVNSFKFIVGQIYYESSILINENILKDLKFSNVVKFYTTIHNIILSDTNLLKNKSQTNSIIYFLAELIILLKPYIKSEDKDLLAPWILFNPYSSYLFSDFLITLNFNSIYYNIYIEYLKHWNSYSVDNDIHYKNAQLIIQKLYHNIKPY